MKPGELILSAKTATKMTPADPAVMPKGGGLGARARRKLRRHFVLEEEGSSGYRVRAGDVHRGIGSRLSPSWKSSRNWKRLAHTNRLPRSEISLAGGHGTVNFNTCSRSLHAPLFLSSSTIPSGHKSQTKFPTAGTKSFFSNLLVIPSPTKRTRTTG